jgi:hypothetical protein
MAQKGGAVWHPLCQSIACGPPTRGESNRAASGCGSIMEAGLRRAALANLPAQYRLYRNVAPARMDRVERTRHHGPPIFAPEGD